MKYHELTLRVTGEPVDIVARLARTAGFEPYVVYEAGGQWSYAGGALGEIVVDRHGARTRWGDSENLHGPDENPFATVSRFLGEVPIRDWRTYGWAAFELGHLQAGRPHLAGDDTLLHLIIPRAEVRLSDGHALVRATDRDTLRRFADLVGAEEPASVYETRPFSLGQENKATYQAAVSAAVAEIQQGQLDKVIVSRVVPVGFEVDLVGTYVAGRRANTPARSYLLNMGELRATGFCPETLLQAGPDGRVVVRLLAGTRSRTGDPVRDEQLRAELVRDPKEIYEHSISLRAAVAELAEICAPDSVSVQQFMAIRERGSVQHLESTLVGRLADGLSTWDALGRSIPAAAVTGIPRDAAYAAIHRFETAPRGLYGGAVLTCDERGDIDAGLVLRSIFARGDSTWLRAGAGIVAQSQPEREFEETCEKLGSVAPYLVCAPELTLRGGFKQW
jgi:salicylate synthetase